jgi:hypothetical protein
LRGKTIQKNILESDFTKFLEQVTPKEEWLNMLKESTIDLWKEQGVSINKEVEVYERKLKMFEEKRKRIFEMREEGSTTNEEFQERKGEVDNDILATKI